MSNQLSIRREDLLWNCWPMWSNCGRKLRGSISRENYWQFLQILVFRNNPDVVIQLGQAAAPHLSQIRV